MTDTNVGENGYLTQEGRIAYDMSKTRSLLRLETKRLLDLDTRLAANKKAVAEDEAYRPELLEKIEAAKKVHAHALHIYTNSPWMDVQVKPKEEKAAA